ncbi:DNA transposase THAP9 [Ammospiza nelsoni]|uniref:DNA transposase THAP9 n=1 Tax=Ammospiza caudacuta TaxID=2857398 RepID=UPI002738C554|nr:DNA transposase THAP9 [Ammospiza caudacuta]XP_059327191.1 DNA transposase THAP9 [Ammospiza nelsoni]
MTRSCSALGCTARDTGRSREHGISFHQFPVDAAQRREWIRAVNRVDPRSRRAWRPGPGAILCSRHFAEGDFECYGLRRKLRRGAVPSRFLPSEPPGVGRTKSSTPGRALKQPLPSPPAGDHNYSLQGQRAAPPRPPPHAAQHQAQPPAAAGRCGPAPRRRSVPSILRELAAKRQLSEEIVSLLQAQFSDLPRELHSWRRMADYSPEMRQFACFLHLYHIKAYDYLRKILPLPHPYSLTNWLSNNEAAAGFSSDIFLQLQEKVERGEQACRCCAVLVQDVSLQKQQEWDPRSKQLSGFVDLGAGILDADEAPLASQAIVLMAVGISSPWTAPLGYFLVNSTSGPFLAQLLRQAIHKLNSVGIVVLAVTSGASARGAETARALGIRIDPKRTRCTFQHPPGSAHSIAYFFDVPHALLLIRNALQCFHRVQWLGDTMCWQHVVELAALGGQKVLEPCSPGSGRAGSKGSSHLKVNPASLLFSEGVAEALEHLQKLGLASFQSCSGTAKFVQLMSSLCDVFYGRGPYGREPLLAGNYTKISNLFDEARSCFVNLTDSVGRYIIKSKRKLGFLSLLLNAESLKWLSSNHTCLKGTPSQHLHTHAFSLDPLEHFLRALQQACGSNGSPTCAVFQVAYYKLLASCSLVPSSPPSSGTASPWDVSLSQRRALTLGSIRAQYHPAPGRPVAPEFPYSAGLLLPSCALSNALTDLSLHAQSLTCTAGWVAEQLALDLQCEPCLASLFEADESRLRCRSVLYIQKLGGVSLPSASVHHITSISEQVLNRYGKVGGANNNTKLWHLCLEQKVFQELLGESPLFPTLTKHLFEGELSINNHYTVLVKEITRCYLNVRTQPTQHLNLKYPCGRHKLKRLKGKHLFPSPLASCQSSLTHTWSY